MNTILNRVNAVRNTLEGARTLNEWLGDGGELVTLELAEQRAKVCADCPENQAPLWWEQKLAGRIARTIRRHLSVKHEMGMTVAAENKLAMCKICGCCNRLSVWCPLPTIRKHIDDVTQFPPHCWKRTEP